VERSKDDEPVKNTVEGDTAVAHSSRDFLEYVEGLELSLEHSEGQVSKLRAVVNCDGKFDENFLAYVSELEKSQQALLKVLEFLQSVVKNFSDSVRLAEEEFDFMREGCDDCYQEDDLCGTCMTAWAFVSDARSALSEFRGEEYA
jgi:hypothetical protein